MRRGCPRRGGSRPRSCRLARRPGRVRSRARGGTAARALGKSATRTIANLNAGAYKTSLHRAGAVSPARSGTLVVKQAPAEATETTED